MIGDWGLEGSVLVPCSLSFGPGTKQQGTGKKEEQTGNREQGGRELEAGGVCECNLRLPTLRTERRESVQVEHSDTPMTPTKKG